MIVLHKYLFSLAPTLSRRTRSVIIHGPTHHLKHLGVFLDEGTQHELVADAQIRREVRL